MPTYTPPYPPYDPTDKSGFSYETVVKRWPIILTSIIDNIYNNNMRHSLTTDEEIRGRQEEGKGIIQALGKVKYDMGHDRELEPIIDDGGPNVQIFNTILAELRNKGKHTWFSAPWLFAECYLYRLVRTFFSKTKHWPEFDPFHEQKEHTFKSSASAVHQLAHAFSELEREKYAFESDPSKLEVLFNEMLQMCLWGNATDLSLLTNMTHEDIQKLQSVGRAAQEERKEFILRDDSQPAWEQLQTFSQGRVDIVLDNAGFELFTDLLLADFLISYTPHVSHVVFHPKTIPWFVSDVLPSDFNAMVGSLLDPAFFPDYAPSQEVKDLASRWQGHLASGRFILSVPPQSKLGERNVLADFWTAPSPFAVMEDEAQTLSSELKKSALVIFKGDLNYRKLTADVKWPPSTSFAVALGPLAGLYPLLSLRTLKADVVVGITDDRAKALDVQDPKWRVNGKHALISFCPRTL